LDVEVDFYFRLRGFRIGGETPAPNGVLGGVAEKGVSGLDLGVRDAAVGLDDDEEHDLAADVHAVGEFGIDRGNAGDY
jgi:hypothetical protein